ncbi:MAG: hypothetical protein AB1555_12435 [Nitrospirota bacterium]
MKRLVGFLALLLLLFTPVIAFAEGVSGYSRGNAILYYSAIAAVLIYGIYDIFHKKWLTWISAILIPVALYLNLPAK